MTNNPLAPLADAMKGAAKIVAESRERAVEEQLTELVKDEKAKKMIEASAQRSLNTEAYIEIKKTLRVADDKKLGNKTEQRTIFRLAALDALTFDQANQSWDLLRRFKTELLEHEIDVEKIEMPKRVSDDAATVTLFKPPEMPAAIRVNPSVLWKAAIGFEKTHVWYPDPDDYVVSTLWNATTYLKPKLNSFFHKLPEARTEGGKSQSLTAAALTSYQGFITGDISAASLYRTLEVNPEMTFFIEEFEIPRNATEDSSDILRLLKNMIDRGRPTLRVDKNTGAVEAFNAFGGVGYSTKTVERLPEDVYNRSLRISMAKAPLAEERQKLDFVQTEETNRIRGMFMGMREELLENWKPSPGSKAFGRHYRFRDMFNMLAPAAMYFGQLESLQRILLKKANDYAEFKKETYFGTVAAAIVDLWRAHEMKRKEAEAKRTPGTDSPIPVTAPTLDDLMMHLPKTYSTKSGDKPTSKSWVRGFVRKLGVTTTEERETTGPNKGRAHTYLNLSQTLVTELEAEFGLAEGVKQ